MAQLVDSKQQTLDMQKIIEIAAQNTKSEYSFNQIFVSIMKELTLKNSIVMQIGNTVFISHRSPTSPRYAYMRALNADTAQNFLENCEKYAKLAYDNYDIDVIVSQYSDPILNQIFAYVGRSKPANMGYHIIKSPDGKEFLATAKLGPLRDENSAQNIQGNA